MMRQGEQGRGLPRRARTFIQSLDPAEKPSRGTDKNDVNEARKLRAKAESFRTEAKQVLEEASVEATRIVDRAKRRADQLHENARAFDRAASIIEAAQGLHPSDKVRTISGMEAAERTDRQGRAGRPLGDYDHPFPAAIKARGGQVSEWAREHGLEYETVQSWYRRTQRRGIPREVAKMIEQELGIPATVGPSGTWDRFKRGT